jgi:hypothetical protein
MFSTVNHGHKRLDHGLAAPTGCKERACRVSPASIGPAWPRTGASLLPALCGAVLGLGRGVNVALRQGRDEVNPKVREDDKRKSQPEYDGRDIDKDNAANAHADPHIAPRCCARELEDIRHTRTYRHAIERH